MEVNLNSMYTFLNKQTSLTCSVALIKDIIVDKDEILYKVELQPTGENPLVRAGWDYEGNGFGLYVLPEIDDEVLCIFPNNDINRGVCIKRLNNGIDKVPAGVVSNKIILIAKEGYSIDATIKGGNITVGVQGNVNLTASGTVNVNGATINLNGPGPGVARLGDSVEVSCPLHGTHTGTIISSSETVFCGD